MMHNRALARIATANAGTVAVGALLVVCLVLLVILPGCSSSTDPGEDQDPQSTFDFYPVGQGQTLRIDETMAFSASVRPAANLTVTWYLDDLVVGQDSLFTYVPAAPGRDTLEVSAFVGAERDTYYWAIDVEEEISFIPPEVPFVAVGPGSVPTEVLVTWNWVTGAKFDLVEYLVACSYDGPINESNWDQAIPLGSFAVVPDQIGYDETFNETEDGMVPGERAWFAVRVRDEKQQLSSLEKSYAYDITWPWYLGGHVTDDAGLPLLGVIVKSSTQGQADNTDGSGFFLFDEPFFNTDSIRVSTGPSALYDFLSAPISVAGDTTMAGITLINQYGLGYACWSGEFLEYLRYMTRSSHPVSAPLNTWDEYPVSLFIPPALNLVGIDMEAASLAAVAFWDSTMNYDAQQLGIEETQYFVLATDLASADVYFNFEFRTINYGEVTLQLPAVPGVILGDVVPEQMEVWINTVENLGTFEAVQGVVLHELGHVLGLYQHSSCGGSEYLMNIGGGLGAMEKPEPIHLDERRSVRAIRNIPTAANMADFSQ